jgi:hypothetical protein
MTKQWLEAHQQVFLLSLLALNVIDHPGGVVA